MGWFRRTASPLGKRGEDLAVRNPEAGGLPHPGPQRATGSVRDRHHCTGHGDTIAFVEVKTRRSEDLALSEDNNITAKKRARLAHAASLYIQQRDDDQQHYRFDVIAIVYPVKGNPAVTIYRDAFRA